jgi:hypothetical protein
MLIAIGANAGAGHQTPGRPLSGSSITACRLSRYSQPKTKLSGPMMFMDLRVIQLGIPVKSNIRMPGIARTP